MFLTVSIYIFYEMVCVRGDAVVGKVWGPCCNIARNAVDHPTGIGGNSGDQPTFIVLTLAMIIGLLHDMTQTFPGEGSN